MADASDSKSDGSDTVWVQVPPSAPKNYPNLSDSSFVVFSGNKPPLGVVDKKLVEKNNPPMIY